MGNFSTRISAAIASFYLVFLPAQAAPFHVSLITVPDSPNGKFTGIIDGADYNDTSPNPCYRVDRCYMAAFVNDKSWGPDGKQGYTTYDRKNGAIRMAPIV
jgi:hypothetical protein